MITLPIGDTDAMVLLDVLERVPGAGDVRRAISAAEPEAGMYRMSLTPAHARWFHDELTSQRTLIARASRSGKQRQILRTLNRVLFMLARRLDSE